MNKYGRIAVIILAPILLSIIVDRIWRKVAVSETYRLPTNKDYLGREAVVLVKVDSGGGTIRVEIPGQLEPLKVPAKTAHTHEEFLQDELVFIVGVEGNFYLVDNSRDLLTGKKQLFNDNDVDFDNEE
jgi:membrane protein implicated in regulation of membrane protease activity